MGESVPRPGGKAAGAVSRPWAGMAHGTFPVPHGLSRFSTYEQQQSNKFSKSLVSLGDSG